MSFSATLWPNTISVDRSTVTLFTILLSEFPGLILGTTYAVSSPENVPSDLVEWHNGLTLLVPY